QFVALRGVTLSAASLDAVFSAIEGNTLVSTYLAEAYQGNTAALSADLEKLLTFDVPALLGADGLPLLPRSESLTVAVAEVKSVTDELIRVLARQPNLVYELDPRRFEEVVAELLARLGYHVQLTSPSRDG